MFPRPSCGYGYGNKYSDETEIERKARLHKEEVAKKNEKHGQRTPVPA
jgi:hypothetical protein